MPKGSNLLISLLVILGLCTVAPTAKGQALLPHTQELDQQELEIQGVRLAQQAAQLAQFQQYDLALARAKLATQLAPKEERTWEVLAGVLFSLGSSNFQQQNYQGAIQYLQEGLKIKPDLPIARFELGNTYYKLNKLPQAIAEYEKAMAVDETFWPALNNIGLIEYEQGKKQAALNRWQSVVVIDPNAAEPQLAIAVAFYIQGNIEEAYAIAEKALRLDARYGQIEFLRENLWGDRLLEDTKKFLQTPRMQATLAQIESSAPPEPIRLPGQ
ncbi:cytochrome c biogenesis factor [Planktothricoides sp. SR001]|nr:cytochrome c biogenesis factor [Planktothricoides sp. SR001]